MPSGTRLDRTCFLEPGVAARSPLSPGTTGPRRLAAEAGAVILGWLGIQAWAAVFVAALATPLDDPALVVALAVGLRGGRLLLDPDPL
jgi:hypothetical protein